MLKRKITEYLLNWKKETCKTPLVIKGLRQIGKTYIVKEFAKQNYENAFILDFRKQPRLKTIFEDDFNIDNIVLSISALSDDNKLIKNSKIVPYKTILIFDELQDCPNARSSLKYFKEDGRFDIICTGSLLGIDGYRETNKASRGIGVGSEEQITMYPLDFEEFLWALNIDDNLINKIKECVDKKECIPSLIHEKFLELIRKYICVGGMPEVVNAFIEFNDINEVKKIQHKLLSNFKSDFGIHLNDNNELRNNDFERTKIMDVFNSIPKQLAKENTKFQYSIIDKKAKARSHEDAIKWLRDYGLVDICYNINLIDEPLDFFVIKDQFKLYMSDIGLLIAMLGDDIQFKILSNDLNIGKGMIYENLIAEALHKLGKPLYYYSKSSGLEIDFVSKINKKLFMIESKATNGNTKSANSILSNSKSNNLYLLKLTAQNIGYIDNKLTLPYYLSFYILNK